MISLKELISFKEKVVVSLHDMWFINSTEHYFIKKKENLLSKYCLDQKKNFCIKIMFILSLIIIGCTIS